MNNQQRFDKALSDARDKLDSSFLNLSRAVQAATCSFENFRLAAPTDDIRAVRQEASEAVDGAMARAPEIIDQSNAMAARALQRAMGRG